MAYAGMVQEYNDMVSQQVNASEQAEESGVSDSLSKNLEEWKERADEYSHKFSALAEGGVGEIMSMAGLSKAYESYQKYQKLYGDAQASVRKIDPRFDGVPKAEPTDPSLPDDVLERVRRLKNEPFEDVGDVAQLRGTRAPRFDESLLDPIDRLPTQPSIDEPAESFRNPAFDSPAEEVNIARPQEADDTPRGEADLTQDDIDALVDRNLADLSQGVGREAAPLTTTDASGITYGKTGTGGDVAEQRLALASREDQPQLGAVERFQLTQQDPIDVQRLGVRGAAQEFSARAQPQQISVDDIKAQYKQLDRVNRNELKQKVDSGQLDADDLPSIQAEIQSRLQATGGPAPSRPPPALPDYQTEVRQVKQAEPTLDEPDIKPVAEPDAPQLAEPVERQLGTEASDFVESAGQRSEGLVSKAVSSFATDEEIGSLFGPVGETLGALAGAVSTIDGLFHLFHHQTPSLAAPSNLGNLTPQMNTNLTSKYASSIPTIDSAQQVSAAVSSF